MLLDFIFYHLPLLSSINSGDVRLHTHSNLLTPPQPPPSPIPPRRSILFNVPLLSSINSGDIKSGWPPFPYPSNETDRLSCTTATLY